MHIEYKVDHWSDPVCRFRTGPGEQNMHYRNDGSIVAIPGEGWWEIWHAKPPVTIPTTTVSMHTDDDDDGGDTKRSSVASVTPAADVVPLSWTVSRVTLNPTGCTMARGIPGRPEWNGMSIIDHDYCWASDSRWGIVYMIDMDNGNHAFVSLCNHGF